MNLNTNTEPDIPRLARMYSTQNTTTTTTTNNNYQEIIEYNWGCVYIYRER